MGDLNDDPFDKSVSVSLGASKNMADAATSGFYNPFWEKLDRGIGLPISTGEDGTSSTRLWSTRNIVDGTCGLKFLGAEGPQQEIPDTEQRPVCRLSPPYILFRGMDQRILRPLSDGDIPYSGSRQKAAVTKKKS